MSGEIKEIGEVIKELREKEEFQRSIRKHFLKE